MMLRDVPPCPLSAGPQSSLNARNVSLSACVVTGQALAHPPASRKRLTLPAATERGGITFRGGTGSAELSRA